MLSTSGAPSVERGRRERTACAATTIEAVMPGRRRTQPKVAIDTVVRGRVPEGAVSYARSKIDHVLDYANPTVVAAKLALTMSSDPAMDRPARAEASFEINGTHIRAHAVASDLIGAVDLLERKLRRNLVEYQERARTRHRWVGVASERQYRHGDLPTAPVPHFPRRPQDREIVRRKTFALAPMTPDEAAYEMGLLGHDFYLFTDSRTGRDAVVFVVEEGRLAVRGDPVSTVETAPLVEVIASAPTLTENEAVERLVLSGERFVFYLEVGSGRGRVLYMRYDGHYGLISAAD